MSLPLPPSLSWRPGVQTGARALALTLALCAPLAPAGAAAGADQLEVEGPRHALACTGPAGAGGPAVVLEPGLGVPGLSSAALAPLADALAATAGGVQVCRSDRAGLGQSAPSPDPRGYLAKVEDLRAALAAAGVPPPYVLVGQAEGGTLAQLYAGRYPHEVAGLVLVDAPVYGRTALLGQVLPPPAREEFLRAASAAAAAEALQPPTADAEHRALRPPPGLPVAVVSPTPGWGWPAHWSAEAVAEASNHWSELQGQLLYLWPGATQVTARRSGRDVARDEPEAVAAALGTVLDRAARAAAAGSE
jgi:pimeloyl-ACP methyl ester carboxylesterase